MGLINSQRRSLLKEIAAGTCLISCPKLLGADTSRPLIRKSMPSGHGTLSAIGMGTWITFDVPNDPQIRDQRTEVLATFFEHGGEMIDSSPMYGQAESMLGYGLTRTSHGNKLFSASKIWTPLAFNGRDQMGNTESLWGVERMDLMYVHNLLNWQSHLPQLREWKSNGRIRFLGLSTSHGRRHAEMENLLRNEPIDFVQMTLNIENTKVEERLLPIAADRGIAVVINRPFARGALIRKYKDRPLPGIAKELGCQAWSQFLLLFILSHPDVTCVIPATSKVAHMRENMQTLTLELPDPSVRTKMKAAVAV